MPTSEAELIVKSILLFTILIGGLDLGVAALMGASRQAGPDSHD